MYSSQITTGSPSAFVFLVDQSGSMEETTRFNGEVRTKAEVVALSVNMVISEIISRCRRDNCYRDYFDIAVVGYSGAGVRSLLPDGGAWFMSPNELVDNCRGEEVIHKERRLPDGSTAVSVSRHKVWVQPSASGTTPMGAALRLARDLVADWCSRHAGLNCFPPMVINITDGEVSDADDDTLHAIAGEIRSVCSENGNVLLLNTHITMEDNSDPVLFPSGVEDLPDKRYAHLLYRMSSVMPKVYEEAICAMKDCTPEAAGDGFRAMSYNASIANMLTMLNIGTVSSTVMS